MNIRVDVTRVCPVAPGPCNCSGACMRPVKNKEAIRALERELDRRKKEETVTKESIDKIKSEIYWSEIL